MGKTILFDEKNAEETFENLIVAGIKQKYPVLTDETTKRIEYEKKETKRLGFIPYFLFARELWNMIKSVDPCACADGVQSGCILNYLLGITDMEPIGNGLYFESFINDRYYKKDFPYYFFNVRQSMEEIICKAIQEKMRKDGIDVKTEKHFESHSTKLFFSGENIEQGYFVTLGLDEYADFIHIFEEKMGIDCTVYADYNDEKVWDLFQRGQFENPFIEYAEEHRQNHPQNFSQLVDAVTGGFFLTDYFNANKLRYIRFIRQRDKEFLFREELIELLTTIEGIDFAKAHYYVRELWKYSSKETVLNEFLADGAKAGVDEKTLKKLARCVDPIFHTWKSFAYSNAAMLYKIAYFQVNFHDEYLNAVETSIKKN